MTRNIFIFKLIGKKDKDFGNSEIKKIKIEDMEKKLREKFELIENFSERYKLGNHETKYDILQKTEFELCIRN